MRVFVAGATGAIGRPVVGRLAAAGHAVAGMTRSPEKAEWLRAMGADAVVADALDCERVVQAVAAAQPEAVILQLTDLPPVYDLRDYERLTAGTNRLREQGTAIMLDAAVSAGAHRVINQSIAFLYARGPGPPRSEDAPLISDGPQELMRPARAAITGERLVLERPEVEGIVLRYGFFYGPGTWYASDGSVARDVRRRRFPIVGKGGGVFSFVHVEDAASATVAAMERGRPGIYNVCDDDPAAMREWLPAYARALGAKPPLRVPKLIARLAAGRAAVDGAVAMVGASNAKARRELEWQPRYPSWREGFREALG